MERNDAQRLRGRLGKELGGTSKLARADPARLMAPRPHRVEPHGEDRVGAVHRLGRFPHSLELAKRVREAGGNRSWDVVVSGNREQGAIEAAKKGAGAFLLPPSAPVGEIARGQDQLRLGLPNECLQAVRDRLFRACSEVEVGDVEKADWHDRSRLYTHCMVDEPAEVFDDLYLGLRAGGALRKQRRGEPLTSEEAEAIGRWQRLSTARKSLAIGAFAVGTFGLGFTLGGFIFARRKRA